MNTKYPKIRFTFEKEHLNSFSFSDIKIIRNTEEKAFTEKRTFSAVFTNCKSFISMTYKMWLLENILFRCF